MRSKSHIIFLLSLTSVLLVVASFTFLHGYTVKVSRVIDGDTIELTNGETIRYIGIDTPETKHPFKPVQAFGKEASDCNTKLVEGKTVRIETDVQEKDKYGRTLAYVWVDTIFVNAELVKQGYAQVSTYPPNVKYQELFLELQTEARDAKRGLWSEEASKESQKEDTYFVASKKSNKYHRLDCSYAAKIKPENLVTFSSVEEAEKAGYIPCKVCQPTSTGSTIQAPKEDESNITVYITRTGSKYHRGSCSYLRKSKIPISLKDAKGRGYTPCSRCNPPR